MVNHCILAPIVSSVLTLDRGELVAGILFWGDQSFCVIKNSWNLCAIQTISNDHSHQHDPHLLHCHQHWFHLLHCHQAGKRYSVKGAATKTWNAGWHWLELDGMMITTRLLWRIYILDSNSISGYIEICKWPNLIYLDQCALLLRNLGYFWNMGIWSQKKDIRLKLVERFLLLYCVCRFQY